MEQFSETLGYSNKIMELKQAIFYVYDEWGIRNAVSLINADHVDDKGNIWFSIARLPLNASDDYYVGELVFYRKGMPYHISVFGTANIESYNPLLLKFGVNHIEYNAYEETVSLSDYVLKLPVIRFLTPSYYHQRHFKLQ